MSPNENLVKYLEELVGYAYIVVRGEFAEGLDGVNICSGLTYQLRRALEEITRKSA